MPYRPRQRWQAASFGIGRPQPEFSQAISALPERAILPSAPVRRDVAESHRPTPAAADVAFSVFYVRPRRRVRRWP